MSSSRTSHKNEKIDMATFIYLRCLSGFRLLSQRSGAAHWLWSQLGDALVPCPAGWRRKGIARAILSGTTSQVDGEAGSTPDQAAAQRLKGAMARGYRTNLWTTARIARLIEEELGVDYHPNHMGRLMHRLKWSHQKPERRAIEYNDQEVEQSVIRSINRVKRSRKKLRACFEGSELPSFLR
jgi:transposase